MSLEALSSLGREALDRSIRRGGAVEGQLHGVHVRLEEAAGGGVQCTVACDAKGARFAVTPAAGQFQATGAPFAVVEALFSDPGLRAHFDGTLAELSLGPGGVTFSLPPPVEAPVLRRHLEAAVELARRVPGAIQRSGTMAGLTSLAEHPELAPARMVPLGVLIAVLVGAIMFGIALALGR